MKALSKKVLEFEDVLRQMPNQLDLTDTTLHFFADGVYLRTLIIPADCVVTGKIHRTRHLTIIASGTCRITTDEGVMEVTGPSVFVSEPGAKKAVYTVTQCVIMNPHPTDETDLEKIEEQFIAPSFEALEQDNVERLT